MAEENRDYLGNSTTTARTGETRSAEYNDGRTQNQVDRPHGLGSAADRELGDNRDGMGRDRTDELTSDETGKLISADKVQGTAVYGQDGEKIGSVDQIMINKHSGKVAYAVMSFGGFLGIGERYHPLPWDVLTYDTSLDGYRVDLTRDQLEGAPNYDRDEMSSYDYGKRGREIDDWYGTSANEATQSSTMPSGGSYADRSSGDTGRDDRNNISGGVGGATTMGSGGTMGGTGATGGVGSTGVDPGRASTIGDRGPGGSSI